MSQQNTWIALCALIIIAAAAWLVIPILPDDLPSQDGDGAAVQFDTADPWVIGDASDAFAYAGDPVRTLSGSATLQINPVTHRGIVAFRLSPDADIAQQLGIELPSDSLVLRLTINPTTTLWTDVSIHKGTQIGDSRLPVTHALYAGSGQFELLADGQQQGIWPGFWSYADAIRQSDGAIRDQGLVFSPLLRDQSVFSDPTRAEMTLLVYEAADSDSVVLHLVFPETGSALPTST